MSATGAAPPEIARFLLEHPPFDALGADRVNGVAASVEIEEHPAGTTIISACGVPGPTMYGAPGPDPTSFWVA